jgi:tRNA(His) 5'-end guanylyltransferase
MDYFRWRAENANRNALNAYCYWKLRDSGTSQSVATEQLRGMSVADKNELLFKQGINYNTIPAWQKRGIGFYYETIQKQSYNPRKEEVVLSDRKILKSDFELPMNEAYTQLLKRVLLET